MGTIDNDEGGVGLDSHMPDKRGTTSRPARSAWFGVRV